LMIHERQFQVHSSSNSCWEPQKTLLYNELLDKIFPRKVKSMGSCQNRMSVMSSTGFELEDEIRRQ
jgi:hypothetical protein